MNEADTRRELIDPKIKEAGWGVVEGSLIRAEYKITDGEIKPGGIRAGHEKADYVLIYKNRKLAVIEAKSDENEVGEGVAQAKKYAVKLQVQTTYSTNGNEIYEINYSKSDKGEMVILSEKEVSKFPSPNELWNKTFSKSNEWSNKFDGINFKPFKGNLEPRYYQEIAINNTLEAIANKKDRILLTLATGTGKTVIAFHIAWKLFNSRWNFQRDEQRLPRILFLADRNVLADQAFNSFGAFEENALVRISPGDIRATGSVPTNGNIFFSIFQTFMSGPEKSHYFGQYPEDFFDLIIIDECHRGGARDESSWRGILEYFKTSVQIGLTATPKSEINSNTYKYFNQPVYIYSLKDGIKDGFLTPFKVKRIQTTLDEYVFSNDDEIIQGEDEIEEGEVYTETDFNRRIEIKEREKKRVQLMLDAINTDEKTIVFCANIAHAGLVRDLINQQSNNPDTDYCVRVTAKDGADGDRYLRQFQDDEKKIPTILTTSQKLSTGIDASNIRNIVLMRPVNNMIEFKQIIGRGTRLNDDKYHFNIIDFVGAYRNFLDPDWDGTSIDDDTEEDEKKKKRTIQRNPPVNPTREKIKIKLSPNKEIEIQSMETNLFFYDGNTITAKEFIQKLFNTLSLPTFFNDEEELKKIWSSPITRSELLRKLNDNGFTTEDLKNIQKLIEAEKSDLYDVLEYIAFTKRPITRQARVENSESKIYNELSDNQKEFIQFILTKYIEGGVEELGIDRLADLLKLKYQGVLEGQQVLGNIDSIKKLFIDFQKHLY